MIIVTALVMAAALTHTDIEALLRQVKAASYPELLQTPMTTSTLTSPTTFFQSNFDIGSALDGDLALVIDINDAVLDDPPSELALRAVLAHELAHSLDYRQRFDSDGKAGLARLLPMLFWPPVEEEIERRTDVVAVARGHGAGLIAFRVWLYAHIDAEAVRQKRRVYYDPLELDLLTRLFAACPTTKATAIARPPQDARGIVALGPACF